jgi:hypothetical protein
MPPQVPDRRLKYAPLAVGGSREVLRGGALLHERQHVIDAPKAEPAAKSREVVAQPHVGGKLFYKMLGIAAANDYVVGEEGLLQRRDRLERELAPCLLADPMWSAISAEPRPVPKPRNSMRPPS